MMKKKATGTVHLSDRTERKVVPTEGGDHTKERILTAAERLFAKSGFDGVSIREVGRAAQVPFALVTYHFQTKLGLYQALFRRRQDLLTTRRVERLQAVQITGDRSLDIHQIAAAIIESLVDIRDLPGGLDFTRLVAREVCDPLESERGIVEEYLDPVAYATIELLQTVAPEVSHAQICWAFYFASGALAINNANTGRIERLSSGECQSSNASEVTAALTRFVAAGLSGMLSTELKPRKVSASKDRHSRKSVTHPSR
jgi:AcrR family transcriptional regulator